MVEQQIRTWQVLDQNILDLLSLVKREEFVPEAYRSLAFADLEIALADDQKMWAPKMEARVLQDLHVEPNDEVLEIGAGSGYLTALLASRAAQVTSIEINADLVARAQKALKRNSITNVEVLVGDGAKGWDDSTYDVIVLTGSTPVLPNRFREQLRPEGRLFAIVGDAPAMAARIIRFTAPGAYQSTDLFETVIAPLHNALQPERFVF